MLLGLPYPTMTFLPFYVAEEKGFFQEEGVTLRCAHITGGKERTVQLAVEGETAFYTSVSTTVEALLRGWGPVKAVSGNSSLPFFCVARSEIKTPQDLKGKKVMVGGGASNNQITYLCKKNGWIPGKDITIIHGDAEDRIHVFQDPTVSAVLGRTQYLFWAKQAGFHPVPFWDKKTVWHEGGLCTSIHMIQEHPDLVYAAVKATVKAMSYVKENKAKVVAVALKNIPYLTQEDAEGNYDVLRDTFTCDITAPGIRYMVEVLGLAKDSPRRLTLEDVADLSFLQRAYRELSLQASP